MDYNYAVFWHVLREGQESIVSGLPMRMKHAAPAVNAIQARSWLLSKKRSSLPIK